jgi:sugar phosphate isomerase/epimerase
MKPIGIRPGSLKMEWQEAQRTAGEIGFDGVEPTIKNPEEVAWLLSPAGRAEVLAWNEAFGCVVCSLSIGAYLDVHFSKPGPAVRRQGVELVKECLRAAQGVGAVAILLPHFERGRPDKCLLPEEVPLYVEGLKQVAQTAEETGVYVALETSFSVEQLQEIVRGVGAPHVGVYHDLSNALFYGHDTIDMLTRLADETAMIHVKDHEDQLGEGKVDWQAVRALLPQLPYNAKAGVGGGWYVLETPGGDDPIGNARRNLQFTRELVRGL